MNIQRLRKRWKVDVDEQFEMCSTKKTGMYTRTTSSDFCFILFGSIQLLSVSLLLLLLLLLPQLPFRSALIEISSVLMYTSPTSAWARSNFSTTLILFFHYCKCLFKNLNRERIDRENISFQANFNVCLEFELHIKWSLILVFIKRYQINVRVIERNHNFGAFPLFHPASTRFACKLCI